MNDSAKTDVEENVDPLSDFEPTEYESGLHRALAEEKVSQIECQPYMTIEVSSPVSEAVRLLGESGVSSLLVVQDEKLVGVFTERDVLEKVVEQYDRVSDQPLQDFMTADPTIVYRSDPSAAAAAAIAVAGHRHVPVLDLEDKIAGVVSPRRFFQFMEKQF